MYAQARLSVMVASNVNIKNKLRYDSVKIKILSLSKVNIM